MKKIILVLASLVLFASAASAQSWLDQFLKIATETVGDVVSGKGSGAAFDIKGDWKYQGVAISAGSSNILANVAASASTGKVEDQVNNLLTKAGIKPGAASLHFKNDGSFTLTASKLNLPGTWTKDGSKITINFAKVITFKLVGTIKTTEYGCDLLFDAPKFLEFAKMVLEVVGKAANNSTITTLQQALANVDELKLGFKLAK